MIINQVNHFHLGGFSNMEFTTYDAQRHRERLAQNYHYHNACNKEGLDCPYLEHSLKASHPKRPPLAGLYLTLRAHYAAYRRLRIELKSQRAIWWTLIFYRKGNSRFGHRGNKTRWSLYDNTTSLFRQDFEGIIHSVNPLFSLYTHLANVDSI